MALKLDGSPYLFLVTNDGNQDLLKEELKQFFPELSPSFSKKEFLTFKNQERVIKPEDLIKLKIVYQRWFGLNIGKTKAGEEGKAVEEFKQSKYGKEGFIVIDYSLDGSNEIIVDDNPKAKWVLSFIEVSFKETWIGLTPIGKGRLIGNSLIMEDKTPVDSPSRAYLKIKQANDLIGQKIMAKDTILEGGCAPGGASHYLLGLECNVIGIDPAEMDEEILKESRFFHLKKPIQDIEEIGNHKIDWLVVDLNLNPSISIKESLRLIQKYKKHIKGCFFNIKTGDISHIKDIRWHQKKIEEFGFKRVETVLLPSHRREFMILGMNF